MTPADARTLTAGAECAGPVDSGGLLIPVMQGKVAPLRPVEAAPVDWKFYRILAAATLLGVALIVGSLWLQGPLEHLASGVGDACIVAVLLALSVDRYVKNKLAGEIARDVASAVAGAELPQVIRDDIRKSFHPDKLLMTDHRTDFRLEPLPDGVCVRLVVACEWTVKNYDQSAQDYSPGLGLEESYSPEFLSLSIDGDVLDAAALAALKQRRPGRPPRGYGAVWVNGPTKSVPGIGADKEPGAVYVRWVYAQTMPADGTDQIVFDRTTINATVTASVPEGYILRAYGDKDDDEEGESCVADHQWRYPRLFKARTSIRVRWWRYRRPTISASVQT